jgi:hypothetical protein
LLDLQEKLRSQVRRSLVAEESSHIPGCWLEVVDNLGLEGHSTRVNGSNLLLP